MLAIKYLSDDFAVSPQIDTGDLPAILEAGFKSLICNRPDDEELGQPAYAPIEEAAQSAGLVTSFFPVTASTIDANDAEDMEVVLNALPKPILAYCRTGTRCTILWNLTQQMIAHREDAAKG